METDEVAAILEEDYGETHSQDLHIEHFFLLLGNEIVDRRGEIITELNKVGDWRILEKEWPELLFSKEKFPKISPFETERQREERLNQIIRMPLFVSDNPSNSPRIIVSRACKYSTEVVKNSLSTPEIESILRTPNGKHLDCFYLMVKLRNDLSTVVLPPSINLASLIAGNWRVVEGSGWPGPLTFIGHFFKLQPFETEREREWRLNQEVRIPLKQTLEGLLIQQFQAQGIPLPEKLVSIVITRVCTYTNM